jgi:hypothetical protein
MLAGLGLTRCLARVLLVSKGLVEIAQQLPRAAAALIGGAFDAYPERPVLR